LHVAHGLPSGPLIARFFSALLAGC